MKGVTNTDSLQNFLDDQVRHMVHDVNWRRTLGINRQRTSVPSYVLDLKDYIRDSKVNNHLVKCDEIPRNEIIMMLI
jgi:hypothetical protein